MSRRCRASLFEDTRESALTGGSLSSGCDCSRIGAAPLTCTEPLIYGSNILLDPSFEQHIAVTGGGPNGDEVPYTLSGGGLYWPSSNNKVSKLFSSGWNGTGWCHIPGAAGGTPFWYIDVDNPHSGIFHLKATTPASAGGALRGFRTVGFVECRKLSTDNVPLSARINPGDLAVWSFYAMDDNASGGFFDSRLRFLLGVPGLTEVFTATLVVSDIAATYTQYTISAFAPEGSYYLWADTTSWGGFGNSNNVYLDTAVLTLVQGVANILLCAYNSLTTVDNSTTETSFLS